MTELSTQNFTPLEIKGDNCLGLKHNRNVQKEPPPPNFTNEVKSIMLKFQFKVISVHTYFNTKSILIYLLRHFPEKEINFVIMVQKFGIYFVSSADTLRSDTLCLGHHINKMIF